MEYVIGPREARVLGRKLAAYGFLAIDFETATRSRASACAIGLAAVEKGHVRDIKQWLIRPPANEYEPINVSIHGITPEMTAHQPAFQDVWPEVHAAIGQLPVLAHNASFDMSVLRSASQFAGLEWPSLSYLCTYVLSKQAWPKLPSYRLDDIANSCGIRLKHHEPGSDAAASAELGIAICGAAGEPSIITASLRLGISAGKLRSKSWTACGPMRG